MHRPSYNEVVHGFAATQSYVTAVSLGNPNLFGSQALASYLKPCSDVDGHQFSIDAAISIPAGVAYCFGLGLPASLELREMYFASVALVGILPDGFDVFPVVGTFHTNDPSLTVPISMNVRSVLPGCRRRDASNLALNWSGALRPATSLNIHSPVIRGLGVGAVIVNRSGGALSVSKTLISVNATRFDAPDLLAMAVN